MNVTVETSYSLGPMCLSLSNYVEAHIETCSTGQVEALTYSLAQLTDVLAEKGILLEDDIARIFPTSAILKLQPE